MSPLASRPSKILFLTSCPVAWGGSEELWSGAALVLRQRGHVILTGRSETWPPGRLHPRWRRLQAAGVGVKNFTVGSLAQAVVDAINRFIPTLFRPAKRLHNLALALKLRLLAPDLVVISQGQSFDGCYPVMLPEISKTAGIPYVLISQKAAEIHWPDDSQLRLLRRGYLDAAAIYFVSRHNCRLVSQQLALDIPAAQIVQNPFLVSHEQPLPWPDCSDGVWRLACVARMWPLEKAQDVLLNVLAMEKWRSRSLEVNFFGEGPMAHALQAMARHLRLERVSFPGFTPPTEIWAKHHALVLPTRAEGLPLAQVEAMLCGRPVIVADAGGTSEIMEDGIHGFLAVAACETAVDHALERAWQCREDWPVMGAAAAAYVREIYAPDPCAAFADRLEALLPGGSDR